MIGPRRPRSPRGSGARLRTEILTATAELLARAGQAEAVSIRAVSKLVGVSAPSIYRHFADKDELIEAAVAKVFEDLDAAMQAADNSALPAVLRLRELGVAYVRFAIAHPEQYRLGLTPTAHVGAVDQVLGTGAFQRFADTMRAAMAEGTIDEGDPVPIVLELWAAAHGIASLLIAKPFLPWGDVDATIGRVLDAACIGHTVLDLLGDRTEPEQIVGWINQQRQQKPTP